MPRRNTRSRKSKINSRKFRLHYLLYSFLIIAILGVVAKTSHYFGDAETKDQIERSAVAIIDIARESSFLPDEATFLLDTIALHLPFVYGKSIEPGVTLDVETFTLAGTPKSDRYLTLLRNDAYIIGYDELRQNPAWCAYKIFPPKNKEAAERPDSFETDRRTLARVETKMYSRSGYDRGHMAPNHAIALCYGKHAQQQTFLMSNIVPQRHGLNAGIWKDLEQRTLKRYTRSFGDVWIFCGPIYDCANRDKPRRILPDKKSPVIPDAFFLIVADREEDSGALRTLAFVIPHHDGPYKNAKHYLASIDDIERLTQLNFFTQLPDDVQAALESSVAKTIW